MGFKSIATYFSVCWPDASGPGKGISRPTQKGTLKCNVFECFAKTEAAVLRSGFLASYLLEEASKLIENLQFLKLEYEGWRVYQNGLESRFRAPSFTAKATTFPWPRVLRSGMGEQIPYLRSRGSAGKSTGDSNQTSRVESSCWVLLTKRHVLAISPLLGERGHYRRGPGWGQF